MSWVVTHLRGASPRELLVRAAELEAEQRRMLDGGDTWSTRKINRIAWELGEVQIEIRERAVAEYEDHLDLEDAYQPMGLSYRADDPGCVWVRFEQVCEAKLNAAQARLRERRES